tara:strand:+ start:8634 stop:9434 length:801 start_codon:yes stop_codon:yes gene_type:complete
MKIFVFGSNGMLGTYVTSYLKQFYDVIPLTRKDLELSNLTDLTFFEFINKKIQKNDIIINCSGIIKNTNNINDMIMVNSVFPNLLAKLKNNVIHITTDCVYNDIDGNYNENSKICCNDNYSQSKQLGENGNLTIIRTSIIGECIDDKSLLEWVKMNSGKTIDGYINHLWNGVTCLELSKFIKTIIKEKTYWKGVRHIFSPTTVSKYDLVSIINDVYNLNININKKKTEPCYRNLNTIYHNPILNDIRFQINELKNFNLPKEGNGNI